MGRAQGHEAMEFIFVLLEQRKGGSDYQTTKTVADESKTTQLRTRATLPDVLVNLLCQSLSHFEDVLIGVSLVGLGTQEQGVWECNRYDILKDAHVV